MCRKKEEVISFKVDEELASQLKNLPNRSEFIRHAVASALKRICPLCHGVGSLSSIQQGFLEDFLKDHSFAPLEQGEEDSLIICSHRDS